MFSIIGDVDASINITVFLSCTKIYVEAWVQLFRTWWQIDGNDNREQKVFSRSIGLNI